MQIFLYHDGTYAVSLTGISKRIELRAGMGIELDIDYRIFLVVHAFEDEVTFPKGGRANFILTTH